MANKLGLIVLKVILSILAVYASVGLGFILMLFLASEGFWQILAFLSMLILPSLLFPLIWLKRRKKYTIIWLCVLAAFAIALAINFAIKEYNARITINTSPNINISEYLPFDDNSKIVKIRSNTLNFTENLPKIDGAAALFPVYSAFVNATYPENTTITSDGAFQYNNTSIGYELLAQKDTDIFIGVYPSKEQIEYAEYHDTEFKYTPIGTEAFVFFVHKDNPINNLTTDQIKDIYSGKITNWKEVGGKDEEIAAFQRNEGSGSQSMLRRFMGDTPIMEPPSELVNDLMIGIIERVSDYKNKTNSIGFSFRYYVEGIIKNPNIKMISVDGIAPTAENVKANSYPITTPIYAVTWEDNDNENVERFVNWILSDEGQEIIEKTGYVGISKPIFTGLSIIETYYKTPTEQVEEFLKASKTYNSCTYYKLSDGKWATDSHTYKYRLELTGRLHNAVKDSTYVILSNTENITFDMAWKASGFSSNINDYFNPNDAVIVGRG